MTIVQPPASLRQPPRRPAERVADAHRDLHELQVELATGTACSAEVDQAEAAYSDSVADATAANVAKLQEFIQSLRLTAEDATGLRELAGRCMNEITGAVPAGTFAIMADVVAAAGDTRRELTAQGVELLGAVNGVAALRADLSALTMALKSAGIAVRP